MKLKLTDNIKSIILKLYNSGKYCKDIAEVTKLSVTTVCSYLKSIGIVPRKTRKLTDEIKKEVIDLYTSDKKLSASDLARKFKLSVTTICDILKSQKIDVINYHNLSKIDENIFNKIDTEEKAYWLGFLYADGYVSKNRNNIELSLSSIDKNHIIKFNKFMKGDSSLIKTKYTKLNNKVFEAIRWTITNKL